MNMIRYIPIHEFLLFHRPPEGCKMNVGNYRNSAGHKSLSLRTDLLLWSKQTAEGEEEKTTQNYTKCNVLEAPFSPFTAITLSGT